MTIKFTIFASQPVEHSLSRHLHEFRHVHAIQTVDSAPTAQIISYTQGFAPFTERFLQELVSSNGSSLDQLLPVSRLNEANPSVPPATVVSRLEFANVQVVNGTFKSPEYQATSGAHHFADPQVIYITEELESLEDQDKTLGHDGSSPNAKKGLARARFIVALAPTADDFGTKWDAHAKRVHEAIAEFAATTGRSPLAYLPIVEYQRHQSVNLTQSDFDHVLEGSPFRDAKYREASGGYEEFAFLHPELLIAFLNKYGSELGLSYGGFAKVGSAKNSDEFRSFAVVCDEALFIDTDAVQKAVRKLGVN